ncbi:hypothetical protein [Gloeocapsa sp. PCC 73106]|uniref:hypothetical protein n=1 Tax=Gloeocapsa sp. PCC 73106 TaxID=102232 RepID=UPI0002ACF783|nr:hypothetical protein [Gloeocapsa sp. PCC 73106]ELR99825.1 hypothetical protein GLO73106DRAFT_00036770 [Gloeocapsa sp. PCC 73106]
MKNPKFAIFVSGILGLSTITAGLMIASPAQAFNIRVFTDKTAWIDALGEASFETEDFADGIFNDFEFVSETGRGTIEAGEYTDRLIPDASTSFTYLGSSDLTAFGGEWDLVRHPRGLGLTITLANGETETIRREIENSSDFDFFGFISASPFESIQLNTGTQGGAAETFSLDNVVYGGDGFDPIPGPGEEPLPIATPEPTSIISSIFLGLIGVAVKRKKIL